MTPPEMVADTSLGCSALLVIDFIQDLVDPTGRMAGSARHAAERGAIANANNAMALARQRDWPVILVRVAFAADYADAPMRSPIFQRARQLGVLQEGSPGVAWAQELQVDPADRVLVKKGISAFCGSGLEANLRDAGCETVLVCGVSSTMAVEATTRAAHDLGFATVVLEDACAAADEAAHQAAMRVCGMLGRVATVAELR